MLYNLPNGKTINLSLEEFLSLTDEEVQFLVAYDYGEHINNPRRGSVLGKSSRDDEDEKEEIEDDEVEVISELDNTSNYDKTQDLDSEVDV